MDKYFYNAKRADATYRTTLVEAREGINLTPGERETIGNTVAPLLNNGQSVYQVLNNHPEIDLSDRTLYRYIETGVFKDYKVDNFSLKEQVNRKQFKNKYKKRKEPANYNGRRYADFVAFCQGNPECHIVEMDTVYNHQSGPFLQTFMFANVGFMIGRIHSARTSECMASSFDHYQERLGNDFFHELFQLVLADRGSEYEKFHLFERDPDGNDRLRIFYCDPMQSSQKPHVENNHNFVRDIIPNGKSLDSLSQDDINLMFSHINSVPRKSMKGKTPFQAFSFFFGDEITEKLEISAISPDDVVLRPSLIFRS
jgi:IS30 family transposase